MRTIQVLDGNDTIESGDWVRPLELTGDHSTENVYSGLPENNSKWCSVDIYCPFWVGKSTANFDKALRLSHEFIRGEISESHKI